MGCFEIIIVVTHAYSNILLLPSPGLAGWQTIVAQIVAQFDTFANMLLRTSSFK